MITDQVWRFAEGACPRCGQECLVHRAKRTYSAVDACEHVTSEHEVVCRGRGCGLWARPLTASEVEEGGDNWVGVTGDGTWIRWP